MLGLDENAGKLLAEYSLRALRFLCIVLAGQGVLCPPESQERCKSTTKRHCNTIKAFRAKQLTRVSSGRRGSGLVHPLDLYRGGHLVETFVWKDIYG